MKTKAIIGAIIAVGIVVIGSVYFMTSTPAHATTSTNTGLTTDAVSQGNTSTSNANNTNSNSNANSSNVNSNSTATTNNSNNQKNNNNNENNSASHTSAQQSNSNNNHINNNQSNNNSQAQSQPKEQQALAPKPTAPTITSTGNFADIINGATYMSGTIDGVGVVIPLKGGHVVNNLLVLPEYYTSRLNETFTAKIASLGNNNFDLYEYYNGKNTAIFKLKYDVNQGGLPSLGGTFTHTGSNEVTGITFNLVNNNYAGQLQAMPFYHTNIAGTPVTIAPAGPNGWNYSEHYSGDNNPFTLKIDYNITGKNYRLGLEETYNGQKTGEYLLNPISGTNNYSGVFIAHPGTPKAKSYNVTLTGSLNPM